MDAVNWHDILQHFRIHFPPSSTVSVAVLGILTLITASSYGLVHDIVRPYFSPLRSLKGPRNGSFIFGNLKEILADKSPGTWTKEMVKKYGNIFVFKVWINQDRLFLNDPKALHHVLTNSTVYTKLEEVRYSFREVMGDGLLVVEGQDHKRQRRIMNPAFGVLSIRDMTEIFVTKSLELRDALASLTTREQQHGWTSVDMLAYLSSTTLDIIGLAGFNYSFDSVQHRFERPGTEDDLSVAFGKIIQLSSRAELLSILKMFLPLFRLIIWDYRSRILRKASKTVRRIGRQLVKERRMALQSGREQGKAKDLLTLLVKANLNEGGSNDRNMSDDEVMDQIPTFLMAGHETTSTSTTWALYSLAIYPEIQERLREELLTVSTENPTMDELNSLPYLERFVRETLRYHGIVRGTTRVATQDDFIPVDKPFDDKYGNVHHSIRVAKGDAIFIPIHTMDTDESIWGSNAGEFNPDRWVNPPEGSSVIPGVWGNQLSFLGGPRACIGFRFALVEMKALLFELIRSFELKLGVPVDDIIPQSGVVVRPVVQSQLEKGGQLPMLIRRIR